MKMIKICNCTLFNKKILVLNALLFYTGFAVKGPCERNFNGCCPNTQWNSTMEMCVDCPSGYVWINCSKPCEYPYYGPKCDQTCFCDEDNCDHTIGCKSDSGKYIGVISKPRNAKLRCLRFLFLLFLLKTNITLLFKS